MKIWTRIARLPLKAVGVAGGLVFKAVPSGVKAWVGYKIAGVAASKVGGVLRDQVRKEKAMSDTTAGVKPGYLTTEFWLTLLAQLIGILYQAGMIHDGTVFGKIIALVVMALSAAGYAVSRGLAKGNPLESMTIGAIEGIPADPAK